MTKFTNMEIDVSKRIYFSIFGIYAVFNKEAVKRNVDLM